MTELEHTLAPAPTDQELAENLEMDVGDLQSALAEIGRSGIAALDEFVGYDSSTSVGDMLADPTGVSPETAFQAEETRHGLVDAINRLPQRERLVVTLYYYEGMTLAEIGDVLGVTESRVCQIHAKTMMSAAQPARRAVLGLSVRRFTFQAICPYHLPITHVC